VLKSEDEESDRKKIEISFVRIINLSSSCADECVTPHPLLTPLLWGRSAVCVKNIFNDM
jgi:hypothetical protein